MSESIPSKGVLKSWIFAAFVLATAGWGCGRSPVGRSAGSVKSAEELRLECEEWNKGWLAPERMAQRLDKRVMDWWDRSRHSGDPWGLFERLDLGVVELPRFDGSRVDLGEGVTRTFMVPGGEKLAGNDARKAWAIPFREAGWVCIQSEWRTVGFRAHPSGPVTEVDMNLHLLRTRDLVRAEVRGTWAVEWSVAPPTTTVSKADPKADPEEGAGIRAVRLSWLRGEWLERSGSPRFVERVTLPMPNGSPGSSGPDPLIVVDWNEDGREDLVLPGSNLWLDSNPTGPWKQHRLVPVDSVHFQASSIADFDRDGHLDLLVVSSRQMLLFRGLGGGAVELPPVVTPAAMIKSPSSIALVDLDRDGDLDVWVGQWTPPYDEGIVPFPLGGATNGPPTTFWRNQGNGRFEEILDQTGLDVARNRFAFSGVFLDFDGDHLPEFVQVTDFAGLDYFTGLPGGRFALQTRERLGETRSFGMGHVIGDFDRNGLPDLLVIGMNSAAATRMESTGVTHPDHPEIREIRREMHRGNRVWLNHGEGRWKVAPWQHQVAETGWSWGATWLDSNNDGLGEFYVVNGYLRNAKAYDDFEYWCCDAYHESTSGQVLQQVLQERMNRKTGPEYSKYSEGGHYRNQWRVPVGGDWVEMGWIGGVALPEDSRNVVAWDYDRDGRQDLVVLTREVYPMERSMLRVLHNEGSSGSWLAVRVPPEGGVAPWGAEVVLTLSDGSQRHEWLVDQQGHRSQPAPIAHFGLARQTPRKVQVHWPDGKTEEQAVTAADQYLTLRRH
jgi:hypothetical protein